MKQWILVSIALSGLMRAQQRYLPSDVESGSKIYRANCFVCHGPEGASIPGVDFQRGQFKRAAADDDIFRVIGTGVPGTAMPPTPLPDRDRLSLVAYIRALHDAGNATGTGNAARGQALFEGRGGCLACHRVNGKGSRVAPDLSEVGAIRGAAYLERSVLDPNESVLPEHRNVRAVTRQGTVINGRRLNEDTHTVQLIDTQERLRSLEKSELKEFAVLATSSMPSYRGKFTAEELADLVTYLLSLKGMDVQ